MVSRNWKLLSYNEFFLFFTDSTESLKLSIYRNTLQRSNLPLLKESYFKLVEFQLCFVNIQVRYITGYKTKNTKHFGIPAMFFPQTGFKKYKILTALTKQINFFEMNRYQVKVKHNKIAKYVHKFVRNKLHHYFVNYSTSILHLINITTLED